VTLTDDFFQQAQREGYLAYEAGDLPRDSLHGRFVRFLRLYSYDCLKPADKAALRRSFERGWLRAHDDWLRSQTSRTKRFVDWCIAHSVAVYVIWGILTVLIIAALVRCVAYGHF
jgi:hypothetical protein